MKLGNEWEKINVIKRERKNKYLNELEGKYWAWCKSIEKLLY